MIVIDGKSRDHVSNLIGVRHWGTEGVPTLGK